MDEAALPDAGKSGEEWISYNVNWSEQRYSPLKQIDATNVSRLGIGWYMGIPAALGNPQTEPNRPGIQPSGDSELRSAAG